MTARNQGVVTPRNTTGTTHSRMFTPRTPGGGQHRTYFDIRSRQSVVPGEDSDDSDIAAEALSELLKQTWNIWAVSPLFGLDCDNDLKLKQYAKRLREIVASSLFQENVSYEAKFIPLRDLVCHPADPPAVKVLVHSKVHEQDKITCIYQGILLSWGDRHDVEAKSVKLPILLSRGSQTVTQAVHSVLSQMFDCSITAMPATQEDLMWLTTIILNSCNKQGTTGELTLEYQIPGRPASDSITVKFPVDSIITLWSKICPMQQSSINPQEQIASVIELEQVKKFFECIRIQILDNANLELEYCLLNTLSLPSLTIKSNKMKATDITAIDQVLWFFQEKALRYSPTLFSPMNNEEA